LFLYALSMDGTSTTQSVQVQHIRNATVKIKYADTTFLVDPMLGRKASDVGWGPYGGRGCSDVSHTHLDHWDDAAQELLPRSIPLFAQDEVDSQIIRAQGFTNVRILGEDRVFEGVHLAKTGGQHGTDSMYSSRDLAEILGKVMGIVFQAPRSKTVYVAGDTVWDSEVDQTLAKFNPDVVILNTGDARLTGFDDSIIMGKDDTLHAHRAAPNATIIAVHMDAINRTVLTREELREYVQQKNIQDRVLIPDDDEILKF
ncbi:hypothetical protein BGZ82_003046, partial [Podila clonocystis]